MASPTSVSRTTTAVTTASASWTVNLDPNLASGDLLIIVLRESTGFATTWPSGYQNFLSDGTNTWHDLDLDASDDIVTVIARDCDGTEPSSITVGLSSAGKGCAVAYRISGAAAYGTISPDILSAIGTTVNPDPPSENVTNGPKDILALAIDTHGGEQTATVTYPTNYVNTGQVTSGGGGTTVTNCQINYCDRQLTNVSSEDPSAFTISGAGSGFTALTILVHPAGAATVTAAAAGRLRVRSKAAASLTIPAAAVGRLRLRGRAVGGRVVTGQAVGRLRLRSTAVGTPVVPAAAVGRVRLRSTAVGTRIVAAAAQGRIRLRSQAASTILVNGAASGRIRLRSAASGGRIITAAALGRVRLRSRAVGAIVVSGAAQGRIRLRSAAVGLRVVASQAAGRVRLWSRATAQNTAVGRAVGRVRLRSSSSGKSIVGAQAHGRVRVRSTATATVTGETIVNGAAHGRIRIRSRAVGSAVAMGRAAGRIRLRSRATAQQTAIARAHGRVRLRSASTASLIGPNQHQGEAVLVGVAHMGFDPDHESRRVEAYSGAHGSFYPGSNRRRVKRAVKNVTNWRVS